MGALTATVVKKTEFSGDLKIKIFTVTPAAASDTVDLSSYFDTIYGVIPVLEGGLDANLALIQASFSGTTVTLKQLKEDGSTNADDWASASIRLIVIGSDNGVSG